MQVVQTPSPWAMVASRCTWRPSTRPIASVSASHSWGNSWATWETGQCCWHSCSPTGQVAHRGGVALVGEDLRPAPRPGRARGRLGDDRVEALLDERRRGGRRTRARPRRRRSRRGSAAPGRRGRRTAGRSASRPASVSANTLAGRPRPRVRLARAARGPRRRPPRAAGRGGGVRRPGVRSRRSARAAAVDGPLTRIDRATRSRVGCVGPAARARRIPQHQCAVNGGAHSTKGHLSCRDLGDTAPATATGGSVRCGSRLGS